jgi:hypothetical protein
MRAIVGVAVASVLSATLGCTKKDPLYCAGGICDGGTMEAMIDAPSEEAEAAGGCNNDPDCAGRSDNKHVCDTGTHTCVECTASPQCPTPKPFCRSQTCDLCMKDSECDGPNVCLNNGQCAPDSDVVYVQRTNAACTGGNGTAAQPYCRSQDAVKDLSSKSIVVILPSPSLAVGGFNISADTLASPKGPILIVGQPDASISAGGSDFAGVHVSGSFDVTVRDLKIANGTVTGIAADMGATVHVTRCVIEGNAGGVLIDGAGYEITNTIIAANSSVPTSGCGPWAGACIKGTVPTGAPAVFLNNTVASNNGPGVTCESAATMLRNCIITGNATADSSICTFLPCCGPGNINLDPSTYYLQAGSSCIDRLDPASAPAVDIAGNPRPQAPVGTAMPKSDCGADEFVPN